MATTLLYSIFMLCGLAVSAAVILYLTSQKFAVEKSPLVDAIDKVLPQANCGGCGKAGCRDFANACAKASEEEFKNLKCPVGGNIVMEKIAKLKSFKTVKQKRACAVLRCQGTCQNAPDNIEYTGIESCRVANTIIPGHGGCPNGCLRFGDCVQVCQFGALTLDQETGIPVIDYKKCTSCGACVKRCPRDLFEIRPIQDNAQVYVACRNQQKGAIARKNCKVACIACGKCAKKNELITIENNLAYIPADVLPQKYGEELEKECPVKAIRYCSDMAEGEDDEN